MYLLCCCCFLIMILMELYSNVSWLKRDVKKTLLVYLYWKHHCMSYISKFYNTPLVTASGQTLVRWAITKLKIQLEKYWEWDESCSTRACEVKDECVSQTAVHPWAQLCHYHFLHMMDRWAHHLYAYFLSLRLSLSPVFPQVFIGGCSVNAFSGLPMSDFFSLPFKSVSTLPDSFLNLHRHIQMLAEHREFVKCHQLALISHLTFARCTLTVFQS